MGNSATKMLSNTKTKVEKLFTSRLRLPFKGIIVGSSAPQRQNFS